MKTDIFEAIYNLAQPEIERLNSEIVGDEALEGTIFEVCSSKEMPEELAVLLKIQGLALGIMNKYN